MIEVRPFAPLEIRSGLRGELLGAHRRARFGGTGHDRHDLVHRVRLRGHDRDPAPEPVDVDAVGDLEHVRHVVADEDHRDARVADLEDQLEHMGGLLDAERRGRLVEDDDLRAERRRAGHRHALALAAGERLDLLVDVLNGHDPELGHLLLGLGAHLGAVELAEDAAEHAGGARLAAEEQVVGDVEGRADGEGLVDGLDPVATGVDRRLHLDGLTVHEDLALVGDDGAREALDQRRLAGAVVADDREDLARHQLEVGAAERGHVAVALDQTARFENRGGRHAFTFRIHWSMATATMIRMPTAKSCQRTSTPVRVKPLRSTPTMSAPKSVPMTRPRPPKSEVPPITTAVIESRLAVEPACGEAEAMRPISIQPATAQMSPATM